MRILSIFSILSLAVACTSSKGDDTATDGDVTTDTDPLDVDDDGDGQTENDGDCDDTNADIYTGADETCDGVDNNCSGDETDATDQTTWYADGDGDTYGDVNTSMDSCDQPSGYVDNSNDCNDAEALAWTDAEDLCDGVDNNCSGDETDATDQTTWYADADADTYGDATDADADGVADNIITSCDQPSGYVDNADDCNDTEATAWTGAAEVCDGVDNNCVDGETDATDQTNWYADADSDTYGDATDADSDGVADNMIMSCDQPSGYVDNADDCNDGEATAWTGAAELCDGVDNNCVDGETDATDQTNWYADTDSDTYGDATDADSDGVADNLITSCDQPSGYVDNADDCNDGEALAWTGNAEVCDGVDNDCSGLADDSDANLDTSTQSTWFVDADEDGYGDNSTEIVSCDPSLLLPPYCMDVNMADSWGDGWQGASITVYVDGVMVDSGLAAGSGGQDAGSFYVDANSADGGYTESIPNAFCVSVGQQLTMETTTDSYKGEVSYEFVDQDGMVWLADGGSNYVVGTVLDDVIPSPFVEGITGDDCDDTDPLLSPADNDGDGVAGCELQVADYWGVESFTGGSYMANPDEINCEYVWSVESTAATANCPTCEFEFDLELTFEGNISSDDGSGKCLIEQGIEGVDLAFNYAYDDNYNGYGAAILYNGSVWAYDGEDLTGDGVSNASITFDGRMFTYTIGPVNYYEMNSFYTTALFEGEAYIGAGEPVVADCDDSNESIYPGAAEMESDYLCLTDADDDGYSEEYFDCDDGNGATYPGAAYMESTEDCLTDEDGDGFSPIIIVDTCFDLELYDTGSYWDAASVDVYEDGNLLASYANNGGSTESYTACIADGSTFDITYNCTSAYDCGNQSVKIIGASDGIVYAESGTLVDGNAPENGSLLSGISGASGEDCDDSEDFTYPGAAELESTTECLSDFDDDGYAANLDREYCYTVTMHDSWGDGWNGAELYVTAGTNTYSWVANSGVFGASVEVVDFCFEVSETPIEVTFLGGTYDSEISFQIEDAWGNVVEEGGFYGFGDPVDGQVYHTADWIGMDCNDVDANTLDCSPYYTTFNLVGSVNVDLAADTVIGASYANYNTLPYFTPGDYDCSIYADIVSTANITGTSCVLCDFEFAMEPTIDLSQSVDDFGLCNPTNDAFTMGYISNFYGYEVAVLNGGYYYEGFTATTVDFDSTTGDFDFDIGFVDYYYY